MKGLSLLPNFFGVPQYKDRVIGQFTYRLKLSFDTYVSIGIYVSKLNNNKYEVSAIYDSR